MIEMSFCYYNFTNHLIYNRHDFVMLIENTRICVTREFNTIIKLITENILINK